MNIFGVLLGFAALPIIGMGFPLVIGSERKWGYACWPYMMAVGTAMICATLLVRGSWLPSLIGILGATFVWGSTELKEQAIRAEIGWYPFNPRKSRLPFAASIARWKAPHL